MLRTAMLRDGAAVEIRPLEPDDADLLVEGFEGLSPASRYARFLTAVPSLPRHWVESLVDLDHRDREALAAIDALTGTGIGVARYVRLEDDPQEAEFAIAITDAWQDRGLGRILLGELCDAARANGIERLSGDVFAENGRMLGLGRTIGRGATVGTAETGVVRLVVEL
jgi:GNAT superfamily N-acetyltransferase